MSIKTNNLYFSYAPKEKVRNDALKNVNLTIPSGSFTAVVGKTGSGKSTLIQEFNGLLLPTEGQITVGDFTVTPNKKKNKKIRDLRKHLGVVFQFPEYQLFEETVLKDVAFGPKNFGLSETDANEKAKASLSLVGVDESFYERSPFELSGGERRKIALAGILAIDPEIIVFDEPTAGLDNHSADDLLKLMETLHEKGKTIVIVTHDMNIVYEHADQVIVLEHGEVVYEGTPDDLFYHHDNLFSLTLPNVVRCVNEMKKHNPGFTEEGIRTLADFVQKVKGIGHE